MTSQLQRIGLTPAKAALMAALAIGLVVVWGPALQKLFGGSAGTQSVERTPAPAAKPANLHVAPAATKRKAQRTPPVTVRQPLERERNAPSITVAEASAYDPFSPPAWSPSSKRLVQAELAEIEPSELEERFGSLRQTGIAMILVSSDGQAAQVGDRTLRVGDTIDGFEVVEINADGVTFKPAPPESEGEARGA